MSNVHYNANGSDYMSDPRNQNVVGKSICAEGRESVAKATAGESTFYNETLPLDIVNQFCGVKFSEQQYASAKCRIDIAKSHLYSAKKHFKKRDYIAMQSYMHCSMNHALRALLELKEECDEKHIDIMSTFERKYIHTKLFSENNFLFWQKISYVFEKIVRGDFFSWPRERFNEALTRVSIFLEDAEEVLSYYYMCTDKETEKSTGGNDYE